MSPQGCETERQLASPTPPSPPLSSCPAAGRRGFDNRGNVVFFGLTRTRVSQLLASSLPPMVPNWTLSPTFLLRATVKAHELNEEAKAAALRSGKGAAGVPPQLLAQVKEWPAAVARATLGGFLPATQPHAAHQLLLHLRLSLEALRLLALLPGPPAGRLLVPQVRWC